MPKLRIIYTGQKKRFFLDGQEVSEEEFSRVAPFRIEDILASGTPPSVQSASTWPHRSHAMAVHPSQVEAARERAKKHGVKVEYDNDGTVIESGPQARRDLMKLEGLTDNDSFL